MPPAGPVCPSSCPVAIDIAGARFNPTSEKWIEIARSPDGEVDGLSFWTGEALLTFNADTYTSGGGTKPLYPGATAVWEPNRNRWTQLPTAPDAGEPGNIVAVWTGSHLLLWGKMSPGRDANKPHHDALRTVGLSFGD